MRFERLGGNRRGVYFAHDDGTLVNAIPEFSRVHCGSQSVDR
ncbi:MAG TPA: hypothetical protein VK504_03370 [Vicinamibacterales bacterium]|jgi:hypothetical protein|nr:hypothetical protein [Vicinamibacterales bacterium]